MQVLLGKKPASHLGLDGLLDFSAELALDGEEALEKLKATRCDVVFTDIRMPIMDGTELMQRIRSQWLHA